MSQRITASRKIPAWNFEVTFLDTEDGSKKIGCNSISEIDLGLESSNIPDGKSGVSRSFPDGVNEFEVDFSRGMDHEGYWYRWFIYSAKMGAADPGFLDKFVEGSQGFDAPLKRGINIKSTNNSSKGSVLENLNIQGYPINYVISEFDAESTEILFEEITVKCTFNPI